MKFLVNWLRKAKEWTESFAEKKYAMLAIFLLAFAESSFFLIPPDVLLIAIAVAMPKKSFKAAFWCTLGSVFGGIFGYYIGYSLMDSIGMPIVQFYHAEAMWADLQAKFQGDVGIGFLAAAAFSPIPYKIATISAGATHMDMAYFIGVSSLGRAARFFIVASLFWFAGPKIKDYIEKYFDKLSLAFVLLLVLGFVAIKFLF